MGVNLSSGLPYFNSSWFSSFTENPFRKGSYGKDEQTHGPKLAFMFKRAHEYNSVWMGSLNVYSLEPLEDLLVSFV